MKDELQRLWASETPPSPLSKEQKEMLMRQANEKLDQLDKKLRKRELREVLPAVLGAALFGAQFAAATSFFGRLGCGVIVAAMLWIVYYMLRHGRGPQNPYPGAPLDEYRSGVVAKFDHQIRLLQRVKYWYVAPIFAGCMLIDLGAIERNGWTMRPFDWWFLAGSTALFAFVIWLNEGPGVNRLRRDRDAITASLPGDCHS
jgi:hypothetical protein